MSYIAGFSAIWFFCWLAAGAINTVDNEIKYRKDPRNRRPT